MQMQTKIFPFYKTSDRFDSIVDEYRGGSDAARRILIVVFGPGLWDNDRSRVY